MQQGRCGGSAHGLPFKVTDPKGRTQKPKVIDRNNGKYDVKYKVTCPSIYDVQVLLKDQESAEEEFKDIKGSVYHQETTDGIGPKKTTIDGPGVERPNDQEDNVSRPHEGREGRGRHGGRRAVPGLHHADGQAEAQEEGQA